MPLSNNMRRLVLLLLLLLAIYMVASYTGVLENFNLAGVRAKVESAGWWGVLLFFALFSVGQLLFVPATVFVVAAALVYGSKLGFVIAVVGAVISAVIAFSIVRSVGGVAEVAEAAEAEQRSGFASRLMGSVDKQPLKSVFLLRLAFAGAPWLHYGLAMTRIKFRHFLLGTVFGVMPQLFLYTHFSEYLVEKWM